MIETRTLPEQIARLAVERPDRRRFESDCNSKVARFQTIKKFKVLPHMLSVEGGELTPTLKVKRNIINTKYKAIIDGMYVG